MHRTKFQFRQLKSHSPARNRAGLYKEDFPEETVGNCEINEM
ncbi:hypothetical protein [Filifactor alocis]|nr:hypothetical protein [Filifactor alocis]